MGGARIASEPMLARVKDEVIKILEKFEYKGLSKQTGKPNVLEQAFLDASGEKVLRFKYAERKLAVRNAKFSGKHFNGVNRTDHGWAEKQVIMLNKFIPFTEGDLRIVVLHEALHLFAERSRPGNPMLSEEVEHVAMGLLGERDEVYNYFERHWNVDLLNYKTTLGQRKRQRRSSAYESPFFTGESPVLYKSLKYAPKDLNYPEEE